MPPKHSFPKPDQSYSNSEILEIFFHQTGIRRKRITETVRASIEKIADDIGWEAVEFTKSGANFHAPRKNGRPIGRQDVVYTELATTKLPVRQKNNGKRLEASALFLSCLFGMESIDETILLHAMIDQIFNTSINST
jgi:hypothetical protein